MGKEDAPFVSFMETPKENERRLPSNSPSSTPGSPVTHSGAGGKTVNAPGRPHGCGLSAGVQEGTAQRSRWKAAAAQGARPRPGPMFWGNCVPGRGCGEAGGGGGVLTQLREGCRSGCGAGHNVPHMHLPAPRPPDGASSRGSSLLTSWCHPPSGAA